LRRRALAVTLLAVAGCGSSGGTVRDAPKSAVARLTPEQLAGQHVIFPFSGRRPPRALLARIRRGQAAGVVFLGPNLGTPAQVRALTRRLRRVRPPPGVAAPLLLMVDQEGGSVKRLPGAPVDSAPAMGASGDPAVARAEGRATAVTLRAAGMNVDLAPVVDVVRPGSALQAEGRGFGSTAAIAARFGAAFAHGLAAGGVAATAKHFPGFGAATVNTDESAVRIDLSRQELRTVDRPPFVAATRAGARLVMLASAVYPALSPLPAVLSRQVVAGQLRRGARFRGVTISDDLQAPLFDAYGGPAGAAVRAARAGVDLLLFARSYRGAAHAAHALARAVRTGRVDRGALERATARVLALRRSLR
jgi:beta-N-acetylhexosaminidase